MGLESGMPDMSNEASRVEDGTIESNQDLYERLKQESMQLVTESTQDEEAQNADQQISKQRPDPAQQAYDEQVRRIAMEQMKRQAEDEPKA